jgi:PAS domain S-box-containing protein
MDEQSIRVLLIEDNPGDTHLVRAMLQDASRHEWSTGTFSLECAERLQAALVLLRETAFDVILLDLDLPDSQGIATFHHIRATCLDTPVVIMSGLSAGSVALEAVRQGAQDYLVKGHTDEYSLSRAIHYAIERALVQDKLAHLNRVLRAIRNINQLIIHERQPERLIQQACNLLVSVQGYRGVWIILAHSGLEHPLAAQAGLPDDAFAALVAQFEHGELPACVQSIRPDNRVTLFQPLESVCAGCSFFPSGVSEATVTAGLFFQEQCYGYLRLTAPSQFLCGEEEQQLLREIAGDIGFALHSIALETQREQADALQKEWAMRWKTTFDAVSDSICVLDADRTVLQCNQITAEMLGAPVEALVGCKCDALVYRPAESNPNCPLGRMEETKHREIELLQLGDRWVQITVDPIFDAQGNLSSIVHIIRDITYLKQIQNALQHDSEQLEAKVAERTRELEQAQEQLVRQERLATLGHLASGLAHELRNPLGAIKNAVYLLTMILESPEDDIQTALEVLNLEVDTAKIIVNNLLDFSSLSLPVFQYIDVNRTVRQALERAPLPPALETALRLSDDLPLIMVDPRQINQALDCLLLNAVQAMTAPAREGDTCGRLSIVTRAVENTWIEIEVRDTGVGIPPENVERIFEPLFTTRARGLGLGLAAVRKIVDAHNGRISVESQVRQGTTFTLHLPIKEQ